MSAPDDDVKPVDAAWDYADGACDECGRPADAMIHVPGEEFAWDDWAICKGCKTRWRLGTNLYSSPKFADAATRDWWSRIFIAYREVGGDDIPEWALRIMRREAGDLA